MYELFVEKGLQTGVTEKFPSISLCKGQIFTARSRAEYNELLYSGSVIPAELRGKRIEVEALMTGSFGGGLVLRRGEVVTLDALTYVRFAVARRVVPVNSGVWCPDAPSPEIEGEKVKRLYEDACDAAIEAAKPKKPWVLRWKKGEDK